MRPHLHPLLALAWLLAATIAGYQSAHHPEQWVWPITAGVASANAFIRLGIWRKAKGES